GEAVEVLTEHMNVALGRLLLLQHEPEEAGLSGTGSPDEEDELPLQDLHVDGVESRARITRVGLGDRIEPNHVGSSLGRHSRDARSDTRRPTVFTENEGEAEIYAETVPFPGVPRRTPSFSEGGGTRAASYSDLQR